MSFKIFVLSVAEKGLFQIQVINREKVEEIIFFFLFSYQKSKSIQTYYHNLALIFSSD